MPQPPRHLFVSYAHVDIDAVSPDITWLSEQGYDVWYDDRITPGSEWSETVADSIANCDCLLCIVWRSADG